MGKETAGSGRNYRGEVPMNITERHTLQHFATKMLEQFHLSPRCRFQQHVIDAEDATIKPVFCEDELLRSQVRVNLR